MKDNEDLDRYSRMFPVVKCQNTDTNNNFFVYLLTYNGPFNDAHLQFW